jgi:low affinity Fe/Cu permease
MSTRFVELANRVARGSGRPIVFGCAVFSVILWAATGPLFGFSDAWQLAVNTATNLVTFLMVFLIQNTQNRDSAAIQAKLDELIRVTEARDAYIGIERLTEDQINGFRAPDPAVGKERALWVGSPASR